MRAMVSGIALILCSAPYGVYARRPLRQANCHVVLRVFAEGISFFRSANLPICQSNNSSELPTTSACFDQPQRLAAHEDPRVVLLAPAERRDIAILVQRPAPMSLFEA